MVKIKTQQQILCLSGNQYQAAYTCWSYLAIITPDPEFVQFWEGNVMARSHLVTQVADHPHQWVLSVMELQESYTEYQSNDNSLIFILSWIKIELPNTSYTLAISHLVS